MPSVARHDRALVVVVTALALVLSGGCDREKPRAAAATRPADPVLEVDLKPLTPLLPNRPTHLAADPLGNMYWVQETDRADDTMFVIGEGGIPRATGLSAASIARALGATGGRGNIHGIAAGNRGEIYFYFQGMLGRQFLAALGQFHPQTTRIRLLATTDEIASATGMGRSLPLARGTVAADGGNCWVFLRHSDRWTVFRFDPTGLAPDGPIKLTRPFDAVMLDGRPVAMNRDGVELSPAGDRHLFVKDPGNARLLRVAPNGQATLTRSLVGLPSMLSTPTRDSKGQLLIFAANAPPLAAPASTESATQPAPADPGVTPSPPPPTLSTATSGSPPPPFEGTYPALLIFQNDDTIKSIGRDHINAYPGFPVFGMRLTQLTPQPKASGWLTYDANSGEFLMLTIRQRD